MATVLEEMAATAADKTLWPWKVPPGAWTYELFRTLPDDGNRYEVIGGKLTVSPSPKPRHQIVATNLTAILWIWAAKTKLGRLLSGPIDAVLCDLPPNQHYVVPDLIFISAQRQGVIAENCINRSNEYLKIWFFRDDRATLGSVPSARRWHTAEGKPQVLPLPYFEASPGARTVVMPAPGFDAGDLSRRVKAT